MSVEHGQDFEAEESRALRDELDRREADRLREIDQMFAASDLPSNDAKWKIAGLSDKAELRAQPHALDRTAANVYEQRQHELEVADAQRELVESQRADETASRLQTIDELRPERWAELTPEARVAVLHQVGEKMQEVHHNIAPAVRSGALEERLLGHYDPKAEQITINERLVEMDDPREALRTYVHEYRHSYQDAEVRQSENDQFNFQEAPEGLIENWQVNEVDYAKDPYDDYVEQPLEYDSRSFADSVVLRMYG